MSSINKRIAVVTGVSDNKGIGAAICRKLANVGVDIFFTYYQAKDDWPSLFQNEIQAIGVRCESLEIDLSAANAAYDLLDAVSDRLGPPISSLNPRLI